MMAARAEAGGSDQVSTLTSLLSGLEEGAVPTRKQARCRASAREPFRKAPSAAHPPGPTPPPCPRPQIQALFVVGFGASGIGGTVVGSLADTFGRKRFAVVYFLLYAAACLLLHVRVIEVLFLGRVLSGIATSLLFSVFESWVVCRHAQRGFPPELLGDTFKWAGLFNGLSAIAAGATAQV